MVSVKSWPGGAMGFQAHLPGGFVVRMVRFSIKPHFDAGSASSRDANLSLFGAQVSAGVEY